MAKERKSSFRGKVGNDSRKSMRTSRGYLNLPEGVKQYIIEENARKVSIDILPYVISDSHHPNRDAKLDIAMPGSLWYRRPIKVHRNVGADNESCICPKSVGKPCPICEFQKKRFGEGADKEETKELYPKDRNLYVVIPIDQKGYEEVPHVWDMAQSLFQDTLKEELEINEENEIFPDLAEGKTLELSLKWKTIGNNSFPEVRGIQFVDREPYDEEALQSVPDLDKVFKVLPYEELWAKFSDIAVENENTETHTRHKEEEEEEVKTPPRRSLRGNTEKVEKEVKEEKEETPPPTTTTRRRERPAAGAAKEPDKCPHKHKFGVDTDVYDDCNTCEIWDDCADELDKNKK
jgi:hypothetical protein